MVIVHRTVAMCAVVPLVLAAACGGGSSSKSSTAASPSGTAATAPGGSATAPAPSKESKAASVDVCGLLSEADASDVAGAAGLGGAGATYTLTATKVDESASPIPTSTCKFHITGRSGGSAVAGGTVAMSVVPGSSFASYAGGSAKPVPGLGDEAVTTGGATVVRVGDLMLETGEDTFTNKFIIELYKKMVPKLR